MTITLQAVNELIASLESAGELSIREQKFLKLAKAFKQLAAENVGLKKFIKTECFVGQDKPDICPGLVSTRYVSADGYEPETPATDRIMAESEALKSQVKQLAAENVALKQFPEQIVQFIGGLGTSEIGIDTKEKIGLAAIRIKTPATDACLAGIKADAITASLDACSDYLETDCVMDRLDISYEEAEKRTSGAIEFHDAMVNFASQMREGADK